ncbi:MAG: SNF2 helicase associated domain-containing protein, partial [Clostridia bacterium]|nr:SNF2 helicase associated domain-containing protein [Clostridia bacterium]
LSARMAYHGGGIVLTVEDEYGEIDELMPLLRALREKRRYFRFRSGAFLDLSGAEEWQRIAEAAMEAEADAAARAASPDLRPLPSYRAMYLRALMEQAGLPLKMDERSDETTAMRYTAPEPRVQGLRGYQRRGYEWLMTLDALHMGGILADDMGLGKTVQMIAAIDGSRQAASEWLPSLIVAPTSLLYNWLNEFRLFAPWLTVTLLQGSQAQRGALIEDLRNERPDVVITSYPLLRRDIEALKEISFHFAVLDEAQQIKNAASVSAQAVKALNARTRVCLTGTPMENHVGELWSLMDFCLPGYLPGYARFLRRYADGEDVDGLRQRIRPFLMRRLKTDVLSELPPKLEKTLYAGMTEEQSRVYQAVLYQSRERVRGILENRGLAKGRTEVLAAITQLRQVCCHPSLCMDGYLGTSGKEELLMDILPGALRAGSRALLFSQFTTMLRLLEKRLREAGIHTLYLDGETPVKTRQELTEAFNGGEGQVFLISLKAGGTGLNLTGADTVIHYDPWWNPAAQDQATSRAYRIGQDKPVTVMSLVTHGTIEEQVLKLGERKRKLFDRLITAGEDLPTRLTEQEILSLFE